MKLLFTYLIGLLLISSSSFSQISHKSKPFKPSPYTPPSTNQNIVESYNNSSQILEARKLANSVLVLYSKIKYFESYIPQGIHDVFVIQYFKDGNTPPICVRGKSTVVISNNSGKMESYPVDLKINGRNTPFDLSGAIEYGKCDLLWTSGEANNHDKILHSVTIIFLKSCLEYDLKMRDESSTSSEENVVSEDEFMDGYAIVDFAKSVNFKPVNSTFKVWERSVIERFSSGQEAALKSRQINIDALYLCNKQKQIMLRRYKQLYGYISEESFNLNCYKYIVLMKADE